MYRRLFPLVPQSIMAADRTVATLGGSSVGNRHRLFAIDPFRTDQVFLGAGMNIMAAQTGDGVLFTGMQIMEIAGPVAEAVLAGFLLRYQRLVMTLETQLIHRKTELILEVGGMRSMAAETVILLDRTMDTLLAGLVFMALVTDLGTLVLDPVQAVVTLMVASACAVAGGTLLISQSAVNKGSGHFAAVTPVAGLPANRINSSLGFGGRNN